MAVILVFIGLKMLLDEVFPIPIGVSLGVIGGVLALSIGASRFIPEKTPDNPA